MNIKYACEEHIDEAMDEIINENETFPIINEAFDEKCSYCDKKSKYKLQMI